VRLDQLADVQLERVVRHPAAAARVKHLLREEQYAQSKLQTAPVGLASRWKPSGASATVGSVNAG
jgi:hypothetical protein